MKIIDKERRMSKGGGGKDEVYGFMSMPKNFCTNIELKYLIRRDINLLELFFGVFGIEATEVLLPV